MKKLVLATHGYMARGLKSSLEIIHGSVENIIDINAFTDDCPNGGSSGDAAGTVHRWGTDCVDGCLFWQCESDVYESKDKKEKRLPSVDGSESSHGNRTGLYDW